MESFKFIGLDLAWASRNNTAAAVIDYKPGNEAGIVTNWLARLGTNAEILDFIGNVTYDSSMLIAIDAPLAVPNQSGARGCDLELSKVFRRYEAGTHPANRTNLGRYGTPPGDIRGETLARLLAERFGLIHSPFLEAQKPAHQFFECYPHPAMIVLFGLNKTLKYKRKLRGQDNDRLAAYAEYQNYLANLAQAQPRLIIPTEILSQDTGAIRGKALKQYEDLLDAVMCAYIAFYYWWWGAEKCRVFGNVAEGHIVTPFFANK